MIGLGHRTVMMLKIKAERSNPVEQDLSSIRPEGQPIGTKDMMISAIAITKGYALAMRNVEHLHRIKAST